MNRNFTLALILQTLVIKIFVRILVAFNNCYIIPIEWTFTYFVMCKCMRSFFHVNGTVQFTFFLIMRLNTTIVTSCDSLIVIFLPEFFIIKASKWIGETRSKRRLKTTWKYWKSIEVIIIVIMITAMEFHRPLVWVIQTMSKLMLLAWSAGAKLHCFRNNLTLKNLTL